MGGLFGNVRVALGYNNNKNSEVIATTANFTDKVILAQLHFVLYCL